VLLPRRSHLPPPVQKAWQLNEQHYGALQGFKKADPKLVERHGAEDLALCMGRRDFHGTSPPMDDTHPHYQPSPAPLTEP